MKKIYITACFVMVALATYAQSGTNSPYSQYGWGVHADQTSGFNRGMNGVGIAFQEKTPHHTHTWTHSCSFSTQGHRSR